MARTEVLRRAQALPIVPACFSSFGDPSNPLLLCPADTSCVFPCRGSLNDALQFKLHRNVRRESS
eukprot:7007023-Alexandrium_andersonii.AAC.1